MGSTLLIPGPVMLSTPVRKAMELQSIAPADPQFIKTFQDVLFNTKQIFQSSRGQPLVIAGSGSLGWDVVGNNLIEPGDRILVLSTGYFSEAFAQCLEGYGAVVDRIEAPLGGAVSAELVCQRLAQNANCYKMVTITHVDTSTGVLSDVQGIAQVCTQESPQSLIVVDGVCSIGCETFQFDDWNIDFCLTASQKALGAPPGLSISMISQRALQEVKAPSRCYFASLTRWIPIMQAYERGQAAYFATLPVPLIIALDVALKEILDPPKGLASKIKRTQETSTWFKDNLFKEFGVKQVPLKTEIAAHGLTTIYVEDPKSLITFCSKNGITIAGGLHKDIADKCVRIGHMGISAWDPGMQPHITTCFKVLQRFFTKR